MSLFGLKLYISTKNFNSMLTSILKSSGLNVEFKEKIKNEDYCKNLQ